MKTCSNCKEGSIGICGIQMFIAQLLILKRFIQITQLSQFLFFCEICGKILQDHRKPISNKITNLEVRI